MCGRMATYYQWKELEDEFEPDKVLAEFKPRFNVTPSQDIPAIIYGSTAFTLYKWGLVPHWAKDTKMAMANARAETIMEKPFFKQAFLSLRCLIPVSGFYEWDASKNPHYIQVKGKKVFALAGIASVSKPDKDGKTTTTCCVITVDANPFMKKVHHRMPVIISKDDYQEWINPDTDSEKLQKMLIPFKGNMTEYMISKLVNIPKNDTIDVLKKIEKQVSL